MCVARLGEWQQTEIDCVIAIQDKREGPQTLPDLAIEFFGDSAPNPFWLTSAPPTNSEYQVRQAFDAGWRGAVWKTLRFEPIVNVSSRYGGIDYDGRTLLDLTNIELITDRTLDDKPRPVR
jgi:dihydropyrimidine dehydrogenase (NAD+) subunit PreA